MGRSLDESRIGVRCLFMEQVFRKRDNKITCLTLDSFLSHTTLATASPLCHLDMKESDRAQRHWKLDLKVERFLKLRSGID